MKNFYCVGILFLMCINLTNANEVQFQKPDPILKALVVLQNKCFTCHGGTWKKYTSSEQWVEHGLIKPGDFRGSEIIYSLRNYGGDMPMNPKFAVTRSELRLLKKWIKNVK